MSAGDERAGLSDAGVAGRVILQARAQLGEASQTESLTVSYDRSAAYNIRRTFVRTQTASLIPPLLPQKRTASCCRALFNGRGYSPPIDY